MSCQKCKYRLGKKCVGDSDVSNNKYYVVDSYNHKPINWKSFSDNGYVFQKNVLSLHRLTHAESPNGQKVGRHTYGKRRFCTLWFWRSMNFANSTVSQKQSNAERLMRCIIYSPHWLRTILLFVVKSAFYILTLAWGFRRCISVVHWKTIFLICYLLDYQQVQENSNVSIILLGDKKEPTKWKTNLVQQILLPNNHFPCYFYFKNHFYWRKEKRCVTCLWLPTKANTQI